MGALEANDERAVYVARPGHADLTGAIKYNHTDMRNVLERASARETAIRTAVGALCMCLLEELGITVTGRVVRVADAVDATPYTVADLKEKVNASEMRMYDEAAQALAVKYIDEAKAAGESLGGVVEIIAEGVMPGLGSYVHYDRKLDGALAGALMSVQAIKGVEFGMGFEAASLGGSKVHDPIAYTDGYVRLTNNAGGIEGGMSNGETIVMKAAMKPIPTLYTPLESVDIRTKEKVLATVERSDVCAVTACSIVCESVVAFELAKAVLDRFSGDNMDVLKKSISLN
jgi:chorismate synthase